MFRDTTFKAANKKRELIIFGACFAAALILNVVGIIKHQSPARELVTQLHVVLFLTLVFYGIVIILRVLYYMISRLWIRK